MRDDRGVAKQRKLEDQSYEERLQRSLDRWPPENLINGAPDAITLGRWDDGSGHLWLKRRHLRASAVSKMLETADTMVVGDPEHFVAVPVPDRQLVWDSIDKRGRLPDEAPGDHLTYEPYEFDSADGRTMLFVQRSC